jgi:PPP family 3-phenylpropionic acid transporter
MNRQLVAYSGVLLMYFAGIGLFNTYSPLWLQSLGFSTLAIGGIASLQSWTRIAVPYGWSWVGDHSGQRVRLMRLAALGMLCAAAALMWTRGYAAIAVAVVLLYACNGAIVPLSEALVSRQLGTAGGFDAGAYGRVRLWGSVGFVAAVLAGGFVLERVGVAYFPWAVLLINVGLLAILMRMRASRDGVAHETPAPPVLPLLRQPVVAWFFASVAFTVLAHTSLYAFFSLFLESRGYGKGQIGMLWAISIAMEVAFFWFQGRWFSRWSPWRWLQTASLVAAARFAAMAVAGGSAAVLVLAQMSHALTFAAHHAACTTLLHRHFPGRLRGRGQALYSTLGYGLPGVLGGVGGGWIVESLGYSAMFWVASAAALLGWCSASWARKIGGD